jgi:hypothetical protein
VVPEGGVSFVKYKKTSKRKYVRFQSLYMSLAAKYAEHAIFLGRIGFFLHTAT